MLHSAHSRKAGKTALTRGRELKLNDKYQAALAENDRPHARARIEIIIMLMSSSVTFDRPHARARIEIIR